MLLEKSPAALEAPVKHWMPSRQAVGSWEPVLLSALQLARIFKFQAYHKVAQQTKVAPSWDFHLHFQERHPLGLGTTACGCASGWHLSCMMRNCYLNWILNQAAGC